jgi:RNA polymerase sigma factor (sigma-70 family)
LNLQPTAVPQYDAESYLTTLIDEVERQVRYLRTINEANRDDVAQMTIEIFLRNAESIRARYPNPGIWAGQKLACTAIDFGRRDNAQCGRGARGTRRVDTIDTTDPLTQLILTDHTNPLDIVAANDELSHLLSVLSDDDRLLFCMVEGLGYTAREVAGVLGISDSTASRRLTRIRRELREFANSEFATAA